MEAEKRGKTFRLTGQCKRIYTRLGSALKLPEGKTARRERTVVDWRDAFARLRHAGVLLQVRRHTGSHRGRRADSKSTTGKKKERNNRRRGELWSGPWFWSGGLESSGERTLGADLTGERTTLPGLEPEPVTAGQD
ncbi:hypothetical protein DPEC_G00353240 [Dallia pectoralis]|uniref:Uncharacterized protein n=1 Tax=Dallia pectoralis TaxID=75939 RepID=A0ACC2F2G2_DALPE|nr:hypothetical protein DPEC_G00353240 [Dallia pectoralis]